MYGVSPSGRLGFAILCKVTWGKRVLIVAPHPDDETIGAGAHLKHMRDVWVVHTTDGAPKNMRDAFQHGFTSREAYAQARRSEAAHALRIAGVGPERCLHLEFPDQEVARLMPALTRRLVALFRGLKPATILAPPYEGGHPDHDATAMAVHAAARIMKREGGRAPAILEYALYHAWEGRMRTGEFLPNESSPVTSRELDPEARVRKCRMMACFTTQQQTLAQFHTEVERFRPAPIYDFTVPPHEGKLHYENYDWGMQGWEFRRLARDVLHGFEVPAS